MKTKLTLLLGGMLSFIALPPALAQTETQQMLRISPKTIHSPKLPNASEMEVTKRFPMLKAKMPNTESNTKMVTSPKQTTYKLAVNPKQSIWGNVITDHLLGIYSFNPMPFVNFTELAIYKKGIFNGGCGLIDDELHGIYFDDTYAVYGVIGVFHYAFNTDTWAMVSQPVQVNNWSVIATETATDPKTGEVFGQFYSSDLKSLEWGVIDYKTLTRTTISKAEHNYLALGITNDGRAYGVADDGNLYQIDRTTGKETLKGNTGVAVKDKGGNHFYQSGEIDPNTNEFYWAAKKANGECILYTVDLTDGHVKTICSMENATVVGMVIPMPKAAAAAPNTATDLQAQFTDASTSGTISFKAPETQFDGTALASGTTLSYIVTADNKQVAFGTVAPGETVQAAIQVPEGMNHFIVTTSNSYGKSPKAKLNRYVGYDVPLPVSRIDLKIDNSRKAIVAWQAPTKGLHQAYIGQLSYDVYRFGSTDTVKVASGLTATTFSETLPKSTRTSYAYGVRVINTTQHSQVARSEYQVTGDVFSVPFFDDFKNKSDAYIYTIVDNNNDGFTWKWVDDNEKGKAFRYSYSRNNAGDDWLMSPPVKLEAGKTYNVSFLACNAEAQYKEKLEVKMGNAATAEAMTIDVVPTTEITNPNYQEYGGQITPTADSDYYIGFHAISEAKRYFIYLGGISIEPVSANNAPAAVDNLSVVANPTGALKSAVSFMAPAKTVEGKTLNKIEKIEVRNGGRVLKTIVKPTPGAEIKFIDEKPSRGINNYIVVAFNENGNGPKAICRAFIGKDTPAEPVAKAIDQVTSVKLTWEPAKGVHGGVVEAAKVSYDIFDVEGGELGDQVTTVEDGQTEYTIKGLNTMEGPQRYRYWAIAANYEGQSSDFATISTILGAPYALPYHNSFKGATLEDQLFYINSSNDKVLWRVTNADAADNDGGSLSFKPRAEGSSTITSGKIDMRGAVKPKLSFSYKATNKTPVRLEITFKQKDGTLTDPVWIHDFANETTIGKWVDKMIELPEVLVTQDYALMIIKAYADGASSDVVYLDNISIADPLQCDAAIELFAPERVKKGQEVNLKIKVSNLGIDKIENAALKVSMNDKVIYHSNIKQSLAMLQEVVVPISYTTTILDPSDRHAIKAELTVNNDLQTDNNIALANILLEKANVLPPTNLTSNTDKPSCIELSWKQPETVPELITDNFEGYEAWGTDFGKWSTYDADKGFAMQVSVQVKYPNQGEQFAFMNWKPNDYFNGNRELAPHSGEKAAVALYQLDLKGNMVAADNWLISQLLTGKEQTISFWVNNVQGNKNTTETFEVLTSSTDNQPASFKKLDSYEQATGTWKEISVKLPEGTRYFAIRHTTPAKQVFVFMVDDITFEASNGPASYNIYRGDTLLARTIQTSFIDENLAPGSANSYKVTAVYPDGAESEPLSITVTTDIRTLVGNAEQPFNVYTIDGKLVYKGLHKLTSLPKGAYIINGKTIVVR